MGLGFYILVSLVYTEAPGFPVFEEIIQTVGDVGEAIVPVFTVTKVMLVKQSLRVTWYFHFLEYQVFRNKCPDTLFI